MIAGLPYDAEVEYLESTGMQWIDTGIYGTLDTVAKFRACATAADALYPVFGSRVNYRTNAFAVYNGSDVGYKFTVAFDNVYSQGYSVSSVSSVTSDWHDFTIGEVMAIDSWSANIGNIGATQFTTPNTMLLFAWNQNGTIMTGKYKVSYLQIYSNGVLVRDMIPVRVGMEGAMYDRVSKKLFRNAGTGSFVTGPDVAVPVMGLHFMRSPMYHAKDYVQGGLVAMWDGIENAGWGTHDPNATVWTNLVTGGASANVGDRTWGDSWLETTGTLDLNLSDNEPNSRTMEVVFQTASSDVQNVIMSMYTRRVIGTAGTSIGIAPYSAIPVDTVSGRVWSVAVVYPNESNTPDAAYINGLVNTDRTSGNFTNPVSSGIRIGGYYSNPFGGKVHCIRLYSRQLASAEIAHNYAVDKERFSLP